MKAEEDNPNPDMLQTHQFDKLQAWSHVTMQGAMQPSCIAADKQAAPMLSL